MIDKQKEVLEVALDKLKGELEQWPFSPERVGALTNAIEVLMKNNPLEKRVAALERQLAGQLDSAFSDYLFKCLIQYQHQMSKRSHPYGDSTHGIRAGRGSCKSRPD